jgi:hypothetical protein
LGANQGETPGWSPIRTESQILGNVRMGGDPTATQIGTLSGCTD